MSNSDSYKKNNLKRENGKEKKTTNKNIVLDHGFSQENNAFLRKFTSLACRQNTMSEWKIEEKSSLV